jgi:hypothetical protein
MQPWSFITWIQKQNPFSLILRSLSNRKWLAIAEEAKKCILLCSCAMQSCTILPV